MTDPLENVGIDLDPDRAAALADEFEEAMAEYNRAVDAFIDDLRVGWSGLMAIATLDRALGRVVAVKAEYNLLFAEAYERETGDWPTSLVEKPDDR